MLHRAAAASLAILFFALPAAAQRINPATGQVMTDEDEEGGSVQGEAGPKPLPIHMSATLTHSLGSGSYVIPRGPAFPGDTGASVPAFAGMSLNLQPLLIAGNFIFIGSQSMDVEWTQPDNPTGRAYNWTDTTVGALYTGLRIPDWGLGFNISGLAQLPTSLVSIQTAKIIGLRAGVRANWFNAPTGIGAFASGGVTVNAFAPGLAGAFLPEEGNPYLDRFVGGVNPRLCVTRTPTEQSSFGCSGGPPRGYLLNGSTGINWTTLSNQLTLSASLGIGTSYSIFWGPEDQFTAENAEPGPRGSDWTSGSLAASYTPVPWFTVTGGTSSFQPLWHADNSLPRFPLWDFVSPANNFSSFFVSTTFQM